MKPATVTGASAVSGWARRVHVQPVGGEGEIGRGHDHRQARIGGHERLQRGGVQVVGVVVAGVDHVDAVQPLRR
ncbi:MAG: hypothetical protein R2838_17115 [Caldilineaceae bacterium]